MTQATLSAPRTDGFNYLQRTYERNDTAGQLEGLKRDGFALIPGVMSPDLVAKTRDHIDRLQAFGFDGQGEVDHYKCVFNRNPFWLQFLDHPDVIELSEAALGSDCHSIGMSAWRSHPNKTAPRDVAQAPRWMHSDWNFFPVDSELLLSGRVQLPIMLCTAHFYLSDITLDLCPTWVVPGSHLSGTRCQDLPEDARQSFNGRKVEPVLCKAGDVLFFRSEIWHSGSMNRTNESRYLLQTHLGQRSIAQRFSPYMDFRFNLEVLAHATPRQRRMMGDHQRAAYD
jgi:hypothetical protein